MQAKEKIEQLIREAGKQVIGEDVEIHLEHPGQESFGDYSSNIAMVVAKQLGKNPMELAEEIAQRIRELEISESVEKVEVIKPGFINFFLSKDLLTSELLRVVKVGERYGQSKVSNKKIAIEHTSPNTNKPLHVGHIRNNVLGMAVIRLLQAVGNDVASVEIINDRGIHICKSMMGYLFVGQRDRESDLKGHDQTSRQSQLETMVMNGKFAEGWKVYLNHWDTSPQEWVTPEELKLRGDYFVGRYYIDSGKLEEQTTNYGDYLHEMLQAWEVGDEKVRKLWKQMNSWFYEGVKETYKRLGSLESKRWFESEIYQTGKDIVEANIGKVFIKREDGSVVADLESYKLPNCVVLRSDGTSIYMTQDIALVRDRKEKLNVDQLTYVVGNEQSLHFKQLFAIAEKLGFAKMSDFHHLSYGMVRLTTGSMSSRLGTVINADDLIDQAVAKAKEVINNAQISKNINDIDKLAEQVGIGAIKYTMLNYGPEGDITFDKEKSISFDGNSGPYLQYTYARTQSILTKARISNLKFKISNLDPNLEELNLLRHLYKFSEVVEDASQNYSPNLLCNFLFELAQKYNTLYNAHKIMDNPLRLALTQATGIILKSGLDLLGIQTPERM